MAAALAAARGRGDDRARRRPGRADRGPAGVYSAELVAGNGAYAATGALPNPGNDAADIAAALARLGFDVTTVRDADCIAMTEPLRVFTREERLTEHRGR